MERIAAAAVIEHVESFIFSCLPPSSAEVEHGREAPSAVSDDEQRFRSVQAAFLMVITLFWTGTEVQKRRAATQLFDVVVEASTFALAPWTQEAISDDTLRSHRMHDHWT